jgi:flagellar biogenesis protein FliO
MGKSPFRPVEPPKKEEAQAPLVKRLGWLVGMMIAGVLIVAGVAYALRKLLFLHI